MADGRHIRYDERGEDIEFKGDERGQKAAPYTDIVSIYFNNIKKHPLLSPQEELRLGKKAKRGDKAANRRMIEGNLRLVINIAKKYTNRGMPFQDLIEEGNIGLIKAVEKFKPNKGCKFSTYAHYWIKQAIERGIINQSTVIRLPIHIAADIYKMIRVTRELYSKLHREPSTLEISHSMGVSGRYIKKLSLMTKRNISLETSLGDDSDKSLLNIIEDDKFQLPLELLEDESRSQRIISLLGMLDKKEETVICMRFGLNGKEPQTLESIGQSFGVTRERIRQIQVNAMRKLRGILKRQKTALTDI